MALLKMQRIAVVQSDVIVVRVWQQCAVLWLPPGAVGVGYNGATIPNLINSKIAAKFPKVSISVLYILLLL